MSNTLQEVDLNGESNLDIKKIIYILNNYYPIVADKPSGLLDGTEQGAAVQLAIWHYTDSLNIDTGGDPVEIFDAARAIIADAESNYLNTYALTFDQLSASCVGSEVTIKAKLTYNNGAVVGKTVSFSVTGSNPMTDSPIVTDDSGYATFKYTPTIAGTDTITATVQDIIPAGVIWVSQDHQSLVSAGKKPLSTPVSLSINPVPVVLATGAAVCAGNAAQMVGSVTTENCAAGTLTYQWFRVEGSSETSLADGSKYTGTDTLTLNILDAVPADAGTYRLKVTCSGTQCTGVADAVLSVNPLPVVLATGAAVCAGNTAQMVGSVTTENCAAGTLTYKWFRVEGSSETSLADGSKYTGTGTLTLNILDAVPADAGTYRLKVTCSGTQCTGVADAVLSVNPLPVVSATGAAVCAGNAAQMVGSVTTENCAAGTLTYKWFRVEGSSETSLTDGSKYTGTGALTLNILDAVPADAGTYRLKVTCSGTQCTGVADAVLSVNPLPVVSATGASSLRWQYCSTGRLSNDRELCCRHSDLQVVPSRGIF